MAILKAAHIAVVALKLLEGSFISQNVIFDYRLKFLMTLLVTHCKNNNMRLSTLVGQFLHDAAEVSDGKNDSECLCCDKNF